MTVGFLYGLIFGFNVGWLIGATMMVNHYRKKGETK